MEARKYLQKLFDHESSIYIICRWFPSMYVFDYYNNYPELQKAIKCLITPDYSCVITAKKSTVLKRLDKREQFNLAMDIDEQLIKYKEAAKLLKYDIFDNDDEDSFNIIIERLSNEVLHLSN